MKALLESIDETIWNSIEYEWEKPTTLVSERQTPQKEAAAFKSKAMNAIFNVVSMEEFKRISNVERLLILLGISSKLCMKAQRQLKSINCNN